MSLVPSLLGSLVPTLVPPIAAVHLINTVAPVVSGISYNGQTMTTTDGTWASSSTPTYSYQWQSSSDSGSIYSNIFGKTSSTYVVDSINEGLNIRCIVTATNSVSSANQPSNAIENWIPSDDVLPEGWWDPSDDSKVTKSGGSVSEISNKTGSVKLEQISTSSQMTIGTHFLNGLNVLLGDGNQFIQTPSAAGISSSGNFSIFAIIRFDLIDNEFDGCIAVGDDGASTPNSFQLRAGDASQFDGNFNATNISSIFTLSGGPFMGPSIFNIEGNYGTGIKVYVDGTLRGSVSDYTTSKLSTTEPIRFLVNRGTNTPQGILSEMIHTRSVDSTREKIEGYLAHKYNLMSSLPISHPYKTNPPTV